MDDRSNAKNGGGGGGLDSSSNSVYHQLQREFRRGGWNEAGANLLAVTCWYAQGNFLYARPLLNKQDFAVAASVAIVVGLVTGLGIFAVLHLTSSSSSSSLQPSGHASSNLAAGDNRGALLLNR